MFNTARAMQRKLKTICAGCFHPTTHTHTHTQTYRLAHFFRKCMSEHARAHTRTICKTQHKMCLPECEYLSVGHQTDMFDAHGRRSVRDRGLGKGVQIGSRQHDFCKSSNVLMSRPVDTYSFVWSINPAAHKHTHTHTQMSRHLKYQASHTVQKWQQ